MLLILIMQNSECSSIPTTQSAFSAKIQDLTVPAIYKTNMPVIKPGFIGVKKQGSLRTMGV